MQFTITPKKGPLQKAFEAKKQSSLILDRRYNQCRKPDMFAGVGIGQELIAQNCRFLGGDSQLLHGQIQATTPRLAAFPISGQAQCLIETFHPRPVIIGDQGNGNSVIGLDTPTLLA